MFARKTLGVPSTSARYQCWPHPGGNKIEHEHRREKAVVNRWKNATDRMENKNRLRQIPARLTRSHMSTPVRIC